MQRAGNESEREGEREEETGRHGLPFKFCANRSKNCKSVKMASLSAALLAVFAAG